MVPAALPPRSGPPATRTLIAFRAYSRHDLESMWSLDVD
jgi:hypothetical protein